MLILDAHQNIAYNAQQFGRNYAYPVWNQRRNEHGLDLPPAMTGLPDALLGRVAVVFASLLVIPESSPTKKSWERFTYKNSRGAYDLAMRQLDVYKRLADDNPRIHLIFTQADLEIVLKSWDGDDSSKRLQGIVVLMEGADPIIEPRQFEEWYEQGVRIVAPAWQMTRYSAGTGFPGDMTLEGYELLEVLMNANAMLDVSHMAERAFKQAVERFSGSIIASHSNPRYFCDSDRCLSDDMIMRLAERDGVMGIMLYNRYLNKLWYPTDLKQNTTLSHFAEVVDYVCQLTGSVAHVGIGSDIDAGYPYRALPNEIDNVTELWQIQDCLRHKGFNESDIQAICGGNMLRKLRQALPK